MSISVQTTDRNPEFMFDLFELLPQFDNPQEWIDLSKEQKEKFEISIKKLTEKEILFDMIIQRYESQEK